MYLDKLITFFSLLFISSEGAKEIEKKYLEMGRIWD